MRLPAPRGPLSDEVVRALGTGATPGAADIPTTVLDDGDAQLALWCLYELHYRAFDDVVGDREWDPDLLRLRADLEAVMERDLREATRSTVENAPDTGDIADDLFALVESADGPSLASYLLREATREQVLDFLAERSVYALKEFDAHSFVLPRLDGPPKTALAEIQYDEYGSGRPQRLHATLYAEALTAAGLSADYGAYVDVAQVETLASSNAQSFFGLHRRLRGAAMGFLTAFEASSSVPCRRIASGIERVGLPAATADYFHEHVEADAVHEQVATRDLCAGLLAQDPELREDIVFGASTSLFFDRVGAERTLQRWGAPDAGTPASSTTALRSAS